MPVVIFTIWQKKACSFWKRTC